MSGLSGRADDGAAAGDEQEEAPGHVGGGRGLPQGQQPPHHLQQPVKPTQFNAKPKPVQNRSHRHRVNTPDELITCTVLG